MFEKKNFIVNCDICDARMVQEESLTGYESITINADMLVTDERSRNILNRLPVTANVDASLDVAQEVEIVRSNGNYEIMPGEVPANRMLLCVNGNLLIHPGTGEILKQYERIQVNGMALYPNGLQSCMSRMAVNGTMAGYPDDSTVLRANYTVDLYFPLRAREGSSYFAAEKIILTDTDIDVKRMKEKKLRMYTKKCIVREELASDVLELFDENTEICVVPSGYAYVQGDMVLDKALVDRYGTKLHVDGMLTMNQGSAQILGILEGLIVEGEVQIPEHQLEAFRNLKAKYRRLRIIKGRLLEKKPIITVNSEMIAASPEGLHIMRCAYVKLKKDITATQILDSLTIEQCARVQCTPEQRHAVDLISSEVASIGGEEENGEGTSAVGMIKNLLNSKIVNADQYIL